jgi:hypothetical protein
MLEILISGFFIVCGIISVLLWSALVAARQADSSFQRREMLPFEGLAEEGFSFGQLVPSTED